LLEGIWRIETTQGFAETRELEILRVTLVDAERWRPPEKFSEGSWEPI
jgi:hypothetical protein